MPDVRYRGDGKVNHITIGPKITKKVRFYAVYCLFDACI